MKVRVNPLPDFDIATTAVYRTIRDGVARSSQIVIRGTGQINVTIMGPMGPIEAHTTDDPHNADCDISSSRGWSCESAHCQGKEAERLKQIINSQPMTAQEVRNYLIEIALTNAWSPQSLAEAVISTITPERLAEAGIRVVYDDPAPAKT